MLRRLVTPTSKRVLSRTPISYAQQRFRNLQVFSDKPQLTTDTAIKSLDTYLGERESYVTKYPEISVDKYAAMLREQLNKNIYQDPNTAEYVNSLLGYTKEEVEWTMSGKYPDLFEWRGQELFVHWDIVTKMFTRTDTEKGLLADIESGFKRFKAVEEELDQEVNNKVNIDWAAWENELGADTVKQVRSDLAGAIEQLKPDLDVDKFDAGLQNHIQPFIDQVKDTLIDDFEEVKALTDDLVRESQFLKVDENGQPLLQFDSPYFMDKFAPEERDQIILEIDNEEWEVEYQKEIKATRISPDELIEYNKQWVTETSAAVEEEAMKNLIGEGAMSARQQREQLLFSEVNSAAKRTKTLETEVNQLKTKLEFEAESSAASGEKKEKKEDKGGRLSVAEWDTFLSKRGVSEGSSVSRDFKHMSKEQVKDWEARSIAAREQAEKALAAVAK